MTLPVVGDIAAGSNTGITVQPGLCARIMTGAPLPPGADAIVQLEWTDGGTPDVVITQAPRPGQHIRRAGEDLAAGDLVLPPVPTLAPRRSACSPRRAGRRPCAAPPARGHRVHRHELVEPGDPLGPGQIPDSNSSHAHGGRAGGRRDRLPGRAGRATTRRCCSTTLEDHLIRADLLITSGGVSVGAYDVVKEVLSRLGTVSFDKVAMQPGMPQGFGTLGAEQIPILTLPGNPVSAIVSFEVFVRPALRRMLGADVLLRPQVTAQAGELLTSPAGRRSFLRGIVERHPSGRLTARSAGEQGSHQMAALAACNALLMVPEDQTRVEPGGSVLALLLERRGR